MIDSFVSDTTTLWCKQPIPKTFSQASFFDGNVLLLKTGGKEGLVLGFFVVGFVPARVQRYIFDFKLKNEGSCQFVWKVCNESGFKATFMWNSVQHELFKFLNNFVLNCFYLCVYVCCVSCSIVRLATISVLLVVWITVKLCLHACKHSNYALQRKREVFGFSLDV